MFFDLAFGVMISVALRTAHLARAMPIGHTAAAAGGKHYHVLCLGVAAPDL